MRNLINFLRKVGILQVGGGTYSGKVGGEYATIDLDTTRGQETAKEETQEEGEQKETSAPSPAGGEEPPQQPSQKTNKLFALLGWVFGVFFLVIGFLSLFGSFFVALPLLIIGAVLTPPTSRYVQKYIKLTRTRKAIIIVVCIVLALMFTPSGEVTTIEIQEFTDDEEAVSEYAEALNTLAQRYGEAELMNLALTSVAYDRYTGAEFAAKADELIAAWQAVVDASDALDAIYKQHVAVAPLPDASLATQEDSTWSPVPLVYAGQSGAIETREDWQELYEDKEAAFEDAERREMFVDLMRKKFPERSYHEILTMVYKEKGQKAIALWQRDRTILMREHMAEAEFRERMFQIAQTLETGSKVSLVVLGTIATGGVAGATAFGKAVMAVEAADAAVSVEKWRSTVYLGEKDAPLLIQKLEKGLGRVLLVTNASGAANAGRDLLDIISLGGSLISEAVSIEEDLVRIEELPNFRVPDAFDSNVVAEAVAGAHPDIVEEPGQVKALVERLEKDIANETEPEAEVVPEETVSPVVPAVPEETRTVEEVREPEPAPVPIPEPVTEPVTDVYEDDVDDVAEVVEPEPEIDEAAVAAACVKPHADRIAELRSRNASQDPAGASFTAWTDGSASNCTDTYVACDNAAKATYDSCGPGPDGAYTQCMVSWRQQKLSCASAELGCSLSYHNSACGVE